jgi:hypothetical protein
VVPPESERQCGALAQQVVMSHDWPSQEPAGVVHWPWVHTRPAQHVVIAPQASAAPAQVVWFGTQLPELHRPEQHCSGTVHAWPSWLQLDIPRPHAEAVHCPLQHSEALVQELPSLMHAAPAQRPFEQVKPVQHAPPNAPQSCPSDAQTGVMFPHCPPRQLPEQHWASLLHAAPEKAQLRSSSHTPCWLQIPGKQH